MKQILVFIFDGYADWEPAYVCAQLNAPGTGYAVKTIGLDRAPKVSMGGFRVTPDFTVADYPRDAGLLLLTGGTAWLERKNDAVLPVVRELVRCHIPVAAICNAVNFLAENGFLDQRRHTGNTLPFLKSQAPHYKGEAYFVEAEAVCDNGILTANGFGALELAKEQADESGIDADYAKEQLAQLEQAANADESIYRILDKYDIPNTISNVLAMESMLNQRNQMFRKIFGSSMADHNGDNQVDADDLEAIKQELLEEFGEAVSEPADMAAAQEKLGELAENVMKTMINSDHVTSLDVREMKMLSAQLSVNSILAKEEQYAVPVMVNDELMNVSVKIVRGVDKKGIVDIMMESELRGKIAATFQAKEDGIHGLVATDSEETAELFEEQAQNLMDSLGGENDDVTELHCAHIKDLDLNHFSMGAFGVDAKNETPTSEDQDTYRVQTSRLYGIAEHFIKAVKGTLAQEA